MAECAIIAEVVTHPRGVICGRCVGQLAAGKGGVAALGGGQRWLFAETTETTKTTGTNSII